MSNFQQELIDNSLGIHLRMVMDENKKFRLQLKAVRDLHAPVPDPYQESLRLCGHCGNEVDGSWIYPCPTIRTLDGEQE